MHLSNFTSKAKTYYFACIYVTYDDSGGHGGANAPNADHSNLPKKPLYNS